MIELLKVNDDGYKEGRDVREFSLAEVCELKASKKYKTNPIRAIRDKCLDCCVGQVNEVAKCTAIDCPLWHFRFGKNIFRYKDCGDTKKLDPSVFKKT